MEPKFRLSFSKISFCTALILALTLLSSCFAENKDTSLIIKEMLSLSADLPAGRIYTTKSTPGAPDYLSESLLSALYGTDKYPRVFSRTESISIRLSSGLSTCEFAVFLCGTKKDAAEIADLCLGRLDTMRYFVKSNSQKLSLSDTNLTNIENGIVTIVGRYVIMVVSPNAEKAVDAAKEIIS